MRFCLKSGYKSSHGNPDAYMHAPRATRVEMGWMDMLDMMRYMYRAQLPAWCAQRDGAWRCVYISSRV